MKSPVIILLFIMLAGNASISGQPYEDLIRSYDDFDRTIPLESLRIDTDRDLYLAGEIIHFTIRGHTVNHESLPGISDIICVELINGQNEIVSQQRLQATQLFTYGAITLLNSWPSGYYTLQAYTAWDRNFAGALISKKQLKVINGSAPRAITRMNEGFRELPRYLISLHPVYGKILKNTLNEMIVKAFTKYSMPVKGTGIVFGSSADTLSGFATDVTGLGSFEFLPEAGKDYYIQFITSSGDTVYQGLPNAMDGLGIKTLVHKDRIELSILKSPGHDRDEEMNLLMTRGINIIYHREGIPGPWENSLSVPAPEEPGIYSVFLVTRDLEVLARSSFFHTTPIDSLDIRTLKTSYSTRDRVDLEVELPDKTPGDSHYSVAVRKDLGCLNRNRLSDWMENYGGSMHDQPESMNIPVKDQAGLVSFMQKYIHTFEGAFTPAEILDLVGNNLDIPPEHGGEILSGVIRNRADNRPVPGQLVVLSFNGKEVQMFTSRTDANGKFSFHLRHAEGSRQITLSCYPPDEHKTISIDNNYYGNISRDTLPPLLLSESDRMDLEELFLTAQVQEIYRMHYESEDQERDQVMNNFYGAPDFQLVMDKYVQLPVMEEVFFELVRGVMVSKSREGYRLLVIDQHVPNVIGETPLILVDGVPFMEPAFVLGLNPEDIESIRVVHYRYYLQKMSFDGIIDIRTRQGVIRSNDLPPGALSLIYNFRQQPDSFRFPDHSADTQSRQRIPDYRNTLYWNPEIHDASDIGFYTSDQTGNYLIELREIRDGKVTASGRCRFNVKETVNY
ncbi:MAG: hypothetical protein AMS26_10020 [Bacteroides sp. SM23_62]|nr:MAG: hypothetical protein AMS26_10020 [Bacteroides sp. SM23_62]